MTDLNKIDTVETARDLSLIKWEKVEKRHIALMGLIENKCGFCILGDNLKGDANCCDHCGVYEKCQDIQATAQEIDSMLTELILSTLSFLREMKV